MSDSIEYDGPVNAISTWMSVSRRALGDAEQLRAWLTPAVERMVCAECNALRALPLTTVQRITGWRTYTCSQHGKQRWEVTWRAERTRRLNSERIEHEKAACPYVPCECGYHEE